MTSDVPTAHDATEPASTAPATRRAPAWVLPLGTGVGGALIGVLLTTAVVFGVNAAAAADKAKAAHAAEAKRSSVLKNAVAACSITDLTNAQVGDGGYTLTVNGKGNDDISGLDLTDIACLQTKLNTPQSVISHLDQTTSLDGRQTETWGAVTESWSYHPDRGLDTVFTIKR